MTSSDRRPVWAEISTPRLRSNFDLLRDAIRRQAGPDAAALAVVKADAYGHRAAICAPLLAAAGAEWLGVTSVEEGVRVRQACAAAHPEAHSQPRILAMCGLWNGDAAALIDHSLTPVVWEAFHLDLLENEAARRNSPSGSIPVHLEIDTGMARQGVAPGAPLDEMLRRFSPQSPLRLDGVLTHFASPEIIDSPQNPAQLASFSRALALIRDHGLAPPWVHAGSSSTVDAATALPQIATLAKAFGARSMARPGLALYGYALPTERASAAAPAAGAIASTLRHLLQPVLSWKTRIVSLREVPAGSTVGYGATYTAAKPMRLALLPVGYADGLRRELSSSNGKPGGGILVRGRQAPIIGRISMDLAVVDISAIPGARIGDEAVLLGEQGGQRITAQDHANLAGTIAYEILCGISDRVPRILAPSTSP